MPLLLFIIVPIIEIFLFIKVGAAIGALRTIALMLSISLLGGFIASLQGFGIIRRMQLEMLEGRVPTKQVLNGLLLMVGAILLIIPGFFTDIIGLILILPFTRPVVRHLIIWWIKRRMIRGGGVITVQRF